MTKNKHQYSLNRKNKIENGIPNMYDCLSSAEHKDVGNQTILDQTVLPIDFHWMDKQTEIKNKNRNEQYA